MNSPETLKMPSLSGLGKRFYTRYFTKSKYTWFLWFKFSFQNCFWNVFSTSDLSQIYKIRNVWKHPSPFSRNTLIPCFEKTSCSLKTSFWKKNCQINSKTFIKNFFHVRFPGKNLWTSWCTKIKQESLIFFSAQKFVEQCYHDGDRSQKALFSFHCWTKSRKPNENDYSH
jgi:hypothetical protein